MKCETYVHKIVIDQHLDFHKDLFQDARARGIKARSRDEIFQPIIKILT